MATKKIYDLCVKVGEYQKAGEKRNRYKTIGKVMEKDDGGKFIFLDAAFISMQLLALVNNDGQENIIVSLFAEKDSSGDGASDSGGSGPAVDDDIQF